jgi:amino acid transporter
VRGRPYGCRPHRGTAACSRATVQSGARFPTAGGLLEYVARGFGNGHLVGIVAWLLLAANAIVTAMVAVSFGSYASSAFTDGSDSWVAPFAVLLILAMTALNIVGSEAVAKAQTVIVYVVLGILTLFAVSTLANSICQKRCWPHRRSSSAPNIQRPSMLKIR